jgi:SAM-dependent methyltransferase
MKIVRKIKSLFVKPICFSRISPNPISRDFGLSRGTPIDRYYILSFLQKNSSNIKGVALEIAENTYIKLFDNGVTSFEILHVDNSNRKATIIGDLTKPEELPENKIDCFVCTQTLNFIFDFKRAIEGCYKILKKDGVFLGTVSGISQISRYDMDRWGDYWRFTNLSMKRLFEEHFEAGNVIIETFGNVFAANAFLQGIAVEDIENVHILDEKDPDYQVIIGIKAIKKDDTLFPAKAIG